MIGGSLDAAIRGVGNDITVINEGFVISQGGDNSPAILIQGINARVESIGTIEITGSNNAGISIIGDGAFVRSTGMIVSGLTDNNEGISIVGDNAIVISTGSFYEHRQQL